MARKAGKIIETIRIHPEGHSLIELQLRLVKDIGYGDTTFTYSIDHDDPQVKVSGKDPAAVVKQARDTILAKLAVKWEKWLQIYVEVEDHPTFRSSDQYLHRLLALKASTCEFGIQPDGVKVWKQRSSYVQKGWPVDDKGENHTYLPDTEETRAKLAAIGDQIYKLGKALKELLGQKQIEKTLSQTVTNLLSGEACLPHNHEGNSDHGQT